MLFAILFLFRPCLDCDLERFPTKEQCIAYMEFNERILKQIQEGENDLWCYRRRYWHALRVPQNQIHSAWYRLYAVHLIATHNTYDENAVSRELGCLRDLIGDKDYFSGQMPVWPDGGGGD